MSSIAFSCNISIVLQIKDLPRHKCINTKHNAVTSTYQRTNLFGLWLIENHKNKVTDRQTDSACDVSSGVTPGGLTPLELHIPISYCPIWGIWRIVLFKAMKQNILQLSLTAEFDSDEVLDAQILQEDSRGGRSFEQKGDFCIQLSVEGGKVKIGGLLVEKCSVPVAVWKTQSKLLKCLISSKTLIFLFSYSIVTLKSKNIVLK